MRREITKRHLCGPGGEESLVRGLGGRAGQGGPP